MVSSADYGRSFAHPTVLGPAPSALTPSPGVRLPTGPSLATDPRRGTVYLAYAAYRAGAEPAAILLANSADSGRTWSPLMPVTDATRSEQTAYFQPQVVVDDGGGVDVTYFALAHGRVDGLLARSATRGVTVGQRQRITSQSFDPAMGMSSGGKGGKTGPWWIGDYQGLAVGPGTIYPFWNDTRTGRLEIFVAALPTAVHCCALTLRSHLLHLERGNQDIVIQSYLQLRSTQSQQADFTAIARCAIV